MYNYGLIILLIIILVYNYIICSFYHNLLSGFWEADSSFCQESDLDLFCLYIDKDYDLLGNRACYLLASSNNVILLNEPTKVSINLHVFSNWYDINAPKYFSVQFDTIDEKSVDIFPCRQTLRFYPVTNKIVLYFNDTITAVLYRNPVSSEQKIIDDEKNKICS